MENPATWGAAERVVAAAMKAADEGRQKGRAGLSTVRQVADALRAAGLLKDEPPSDSDDENRQATARRRRPSWADDDDVEPPPVLDAVLGEEPPDLWRKTVGH